MVKLFSALKLNAILIKISIQELIHISDYQYLTYRLLLNFIIM